MTDDRGQTPEPPEHTVEPYTPPAVTDLGTFEDLTQFNPSAIVTDAELGST